MESSCPYPDCTRHLHNYFVIFFCSAAITQLPSTAVLITPAIPEQYSTYFFLETPNTNLRMFVLLFATQYTDFTFDMCQNTNSRTLYSNEVGCMSHNSQCEQFKWLYGKPTWKVLPFFSQAAQNWANWQRPTLSETFSFAEPFRWQWKFSVFI